MALPTTLATPTRIVTSVVTAVPTWMAVVMAVAMMCISSSPTPTVMEIATQVTVMPIAAWVTTAVKQSVLTAPMLIPPATTTSIMSLTLAMMPTA